MSGAKSDAGDAHALADMVRTDSHQLRPAAGDSPEADGIKVLARTHKTMIWERTREVQRLRHQLREYFPAALEAFGDLDAPDVLELLGKAAEPARAARLTRAQVSAALKRAGRRDITGRATAILTSLRGGQLGQPPVLTAAYAATVRSLIAVITVLNEQVKVLQGQVEEHFGQHPDAEIILSQPGLGMILGARVLAESGDDPRRYADGKARRNYAATSPITRAPGQEENRRRPLRPQRPARRRPQRPGLRRPERLTWRPRLLRPAARQRTRPQRRPAKTRQPPRRHPPRLPQNPHPLRRRHRLGPPPAASRLTS